MGAVGGLAGTFRTLRTLIAEGVVNQTPTLFTLTRHRNPVCAAKLVWVPTQPTRLCWRTPPTEASILLDRSRRHLSRMRVYGYTIGTLSFQWSGHSITKAASEQTCAVEQMHSDLTSNHSGYCCFRSLELHSRYAAAVVNVLHR